MNGAEIIQILGKISEVMDKNKAFLSELDAAIGDGDHGLNMSKGFIAVKENLKYDSGDNIGDILKKTGMALVGNVGGASGPLYGTAFMKAASVANGKVSINIKDFAQMLEEALNGVKAIGRGEAGEKTMIDAIEPALIIIKESINQELSSEECIYLAKEEARKGVEYTKTIAAKKGRASYLGDRSIGHQDPGATSSFLILETIYNEIKLLKKQ